MRLLLKFALLLTLLFAACIGLIRAQPYDDSELRAFLTPPEGCPMPCFMGIRPGVTTVDKVTTILQAHSWVEAGSETLDEDGGISWRWNEQQRFPTGAEDVAEVGFVGNIVHYIILETDLTLGDLWLWLDHPETGTFLFRASNYANEEVLILANYYHGYHKIVTVVSCEQFWQQPNATIIFTSARDELTQEYDLSTARILSCEHGIFF